MKTRLMTGVVVVAVAGFGLFESCTPDQPDDPPAKELACAAQIDTAMIGELVAVNLSVTNNLGRDVRYLERFNPFSKDDEAFFEVTRVDETKDYHGYVYRYQDPTEEDFVTLAAGDTITASYRLSDYYDFSDGGSYAVTPRFGLTLLQEEIAADANGIPATEVYELACDVLDLSLGQGIARSELVAQAFAPQPRLCNRYGTGFPRTACRPTFKGACSGFMNMTAFEDLHKGMWRSLVEPIRAIEANGPGVRQWFGSLSPDLHAQLRSDMGAVRSFFNNQVIHYHCLPSDGRCFDAQGKQSVIAFVYPSLLYSDIHLCSAFTSMPDTPAGGARDTKTGTLVHEATHLPGVYTRDYKYGEYWSQWLAHNRPAHAVKNADNFQYFYETHQ